MRTVIVLVGLGLIGAGMGQPAAKTQAVSAKTSAALPDLNKVVADLNAAAVKFKTAQADFSWNQYQALVQEHDIQSGTVYYDRSGTTMRMAAYVKLEDGQSVPKNLVYTGSQLQLYQPKIKQLTVFRADPNQVESYLILGFGGSGDNLKANWDVTVLGQEVMDGVEVVELDLKPKSQNARNTLSHVTIWVDTARGISLKQIFYQPSGDQSTNTYSNIQYNRGVPDDLFDLKIAPGTSIVNK